MKGGKEQPAGLRLADILVPLSMATDLARGQPPEQAAAATLLATRLAREMALSERECADVYYTTLLRFIGCTASSHEYAAHLGGDDIDVRRRGDLTDPASPREVLALIAGIAPAERPLRRLVVRAGALIGGQGPVAEAQRADCEVAERMAGRLGLQQEVRRSLPYLFERWDGRGRPGRLAGEGIPVAARYAAVCFAAVMFQRLGGDEAASAGVRRWCGGALDPQIGEAFAARADRLLAGLLEEDVLLSAVASDPSPRRISEPELDQVAAAFGDFADLKSPFLQGHSSGVASLASAAGRHLGFGEAELRRLRLAGLLHDLGRVSVPTGIWEKRGALTTAEWEQVRLHPYHTERILARAPGLAGIARLAGRHHERLNGHGYHRGLDAAALDMSSRLLAAADVWQALGEDRPHRPRVGADEAARILQAESLDADAVSAVLVAAGSASSQPARRNWPAGLTDREVDVLRVIIGGASLKEAGRRLHISPSTAHTHLAHIYEKTGLSTRPGLAFFAMENHLIEGRRERSTDQSIAGGQPGP